MYPNHFYIYRRNIYNLINRVKSKIFKNQFPYSSASGMHQPDFCITSMRPQTHQWRRVFA
jgi:hypothetical protein